MSSLRTRSLVGLALAMTVALGMSVPVGAASLPSASQRQASIAQNAASSCADPVTGVPTGPATVSAASTPYGRVLVVGSGAYAGCSLYVLTSDQLHALSGAAFACSDNANVIGLPCDTVLWPALLTDGAPVAGPGVNPTLLGTATRSDMPGLGSVQQVTYAGLPLYRFFLDEVPGEAEGVNLFDPVTSPGGTWYLVDPSRGLPAAGQAHLQLETAPLGGIGPDRTVLAASMNDGFSLFPNATFPVYTLSSDAGHASACQGQCAVFWTPVLTFMRPAAGPGVDPTALGIIVRPDGTHQVTFNGQPLYLFIGDAYIPGLIGTQSINGAGLNTPWGEFNPIP